MVFRLFSIISVMIAYANPLFESSPEWIFFYVNEDMGFSANLTGSGDLDSGWNFIQRRSNWVRDFRLNEGVNTISIEVNRGDEHGIEFDYVDLEFECID